MDPITGTAFAFVAGATVGGLSGSLLEALGRRRLFFAEPFISQRHILRTVAVIVAAGPYMLGNEALRAWRENTISAWAVGSCGLTASLWTLAMGVLTIDLVGRAAQFLQ